jgi:hypothetical protein
LRRQIRFLQCYTSRACTSPIFSGRPVIDMAKISLRHILTLAGETKCFTSSQYIRALLSRELVFQEKGFRIVELSFEHIKRCTHQSNLCASSTWAIYSKISPKHHQTIIAKNSLTQHLLHIKVEVGSCFPVRYFCFTSLLLCKLATERKPPRVGTSHQSEKSPLSEMKA